MTSKRALITGVTGQDGSYLAELLLAKGYEVHGVIRRASSFNTQRLNGIYVDPHTKAARFFLHYGEMMDGPRLTSLLAEVQPDEIYHLAAQSHVRVSFEEPEFTSSTTGVGTLRLLEAIRQLGLDARFYQASSSEMFDPHHLRRTKTPRSTRVLHMVWRSCLGTGRPATTAMLTEFTRSTGSFSTTSRPDGARHS